MTARPKALETEDDKLNAILLAFLKLPRMGRKTAQKLLLNRTPPTSLKELVSRWKDGDSITFSELEEATDYARKTLERSQKLKIQTLSIFSENYPKRFREIDDPPILVHVLGSIESLNSSAAVAIIGTREPTSFGRQSARRIASSVAQTGTVVVSGLAIGCDSEAHLGCLEAGGTTIAIMAHGLDRVYPADNRELSHRILDNSGCLISEYECGVRPFRTSFVERDRLQSGLSQAVLLIETGLKGGSLHTIGFAQKQHRLIACVSHPDKWAFEEKVQGNRRLIAEKIASPLRSNDDLVAFLDKLKTAMFETETITKPPIEESTDASELQPPAQLSMRWDE